MVEGIMKERRIWDDLEKKSISSKQHWVWVIALSFFAPGEELPPKAKVNITDWPAQSPDLNPIENMWGEQKIKVHVKRFTIEECTGIYSF